MPEDMSCLTYHEATHAKPMDDLFLNAFIFQKEHVLWGFIHAYYGTNDLSTKCDTNQFAQLNELERTQTITQPESIFQVESVFPASKIRYLGMSWPGQMRTIEEMRIKMIIDFPFGSDLDK